MKWPADWALSCLQVQSEAYWGQGRSEKNARLAVSLLIFFKYVDCMFVAHADALRCLPEFIRPSSPPHSLNHWEELSVGLAQIFYEWLLWAAAQTDADRWTHTYTISASSQALQQGHSFLWPGHSR